MTDPREPFGALLWDAKPEIEQGSIRRGQTRWLTVRECPHVHSTCGVGIGAA